MIQASQWYRHARTLRCVVHEWVCDISFTILGPFHYKLIVSLKLPFRCLMSVDTCRLLFLFILTNTVCIACLNDTGVLDRALCCWWYEWDFFHNLGLLHCANQIIECFFQCDLTYECFSVNQAIIVRFLSWWTLDLYVSLVSMIDTGMRRHRTVLYVTEISLVWWNIRIWFKVLVPAQELSCFTWWFTAFVLGSSVCSWLSEWSRSWWCTCRGIPNWTCQKGGSVHHNQGYLNCKVLLCILGKQHFRVTHDHNQCFCFFHSTETFVFVMPVAVEFRSWSSNWSL